MKDVVIVGAGISGLAAAWELRQRGIEALVLERSARAGGVIVTERVDGFVIDGGPDSLLVQKPAAIELCRELGLADRLVSTLPPRTAYVMRGGRLVPLPEASYLGLPTRMRPFLESPLFSLTGKLRMATEVYRRRGRDDDESIAQFIGRRFGREAVEYLAEPLLAGIHAGDVDSLSIRALFPRLVSLEETHGSILRALARTGTHNTSGQGAFVSLPGGLEELPDALAAALGRDTIQFNTRVAQVSPGPTYKLTLDTDAAIYARAVIVTAPTWAAGQMLGSLDPALAMACADIRYASTATVAFGLRRPQVAHPMNGTGFVVPRRERKTLMAGTWVSSKWPGRAPDDQVLLRAFLGGATQPTILAASDEQLATTAFRELTELLEITGDPHLVRVFRWPHATPQYTVGHRRRVEQIEARLGRFPGIYLTGSGLRGTGIPDCVADARATAARAAEFVAEA